MSRLAGVSALIPLPGEDERESTLNRWAAHAMRLEVLLKRTRPYISAARPGSAALLADIDSALKGE